MSPSKQSARSRQGPPTSPKKKRGPGSSAASPARKKGRVRLAGGAKKTPGKTNPSLSCYATHPSFPLEIYLYTVNAENDGFMNTYKKYTKGEIRCDSLTAVNFTDVKFRRTPLSDNVMMFDGKGFWCSVIIRTLTSGNSTAETRAEGLAVLKDFFLDRNYTDYPPAGIDCLDASDPSNPRPLDHFLQDRDIVSFIEEHVDESDLNMDFYNNFEACAEKMWTAPNYPAYARSTLGFPDTA